MTQEEKLEYGRKWRLAHPQVEGKWRKEFLAKKKNPAVRASHKETQQAYPWESEL